MNLIRVFNALYAISSDEDKKMWHEQNNFGDNNSIQLPIILARIDELEKALKFYANTENWRCKSYDRNSDYYSKAIEDSGDIAREVL